MLHSITSVSLPGTLREKMIAIAKAGYDGIELFENDLTVSDIRPVALRRMSEDLGIEIVGLQPFRDFEAMPKALHINNLDRAKYKLDLAVRLGTKKMFVCSNTSPHAIDDMDLAAAQLHELATLALEYGIEVGYEALSWGRHVTTYLQSTEIVHRANHQNLGHILDNYHISYLKTPLDEIYNLKGSQITIVQTADAQRFDMGAMLIGRSYRYFPGQGSYPVVEYLKAVIATGYDGYLSHEVFNDAFRASLIDPIAMDGKRSLVWLENIAKETEKPILQNIEFLEFSVSKDNQTFLTNLLENLGFVETYQHKTKNVSLYQLGEVNIVLNRQQTKKAQNVVRTVGFLVKNKENIKIWAKKLNYNWQNSKAKKDELDIPSVKGLGDVIFSFVEEQQKETPFYEVEFTPTGKVKKQNGITHIDHIGHTVNHDLFLSNVLFYRSLLGLEVEENINIFDPKGIVHSRVAKNNNQNIRISLNASQNQGTATAQFIRKIGNAAIQQIALATNDIFQTANNIKDKTQLLPIPANYYDDLRSKGFLSENILKKMQDNHILYDKNDDGDFYHFYLKAHNGLFIEIAQRNNQYNRYGENNAQTRLAAQAREK